MSVDSHDADAVDPFRCSRRQHFDDVSDTRLVAGVRVWF